MGKGERIGILGMGTSETMWAGVITGAPGGMANVGDSRVGARWGRGSE